MRIIRQIASIIGAPTCKFGAISLVVALVMSAAWTADSTERIVMLEPEVGGVMRLDRSTVLDATAVENVVSFRLTESGRERFETMMRANLGRPVKFVVDGQVVSAPVIREPIVGGAGIIGVQDADLARAIAGAMKQDPKQ